MTLGNVTIPRAEYDALLADKAIVDWIEANAPISFERILDLKNGKIANRLTEWIITAHVEHFSKNVIHASFRKAMRKAMEDRP